MARSDDLFAKMIDGYIFDTLICGTDDWIHASEIVGYIRDPEKLFISKIDPEIISIGIAVESNPIELFTFARDMSLAIIHRLLEENYMLVGDIGNHGFEPWKLNTYGALSEVQRLWDEEMGGKMPGLGWYWLCNTDKGNKLGTKVLDDLQRFHKWGKYEEKPDQDSDASIPPD